MIDREKYAELVELLETSPAVAILGPRQVGKTTLAHAISEDRDSLYLDLESEADRTKLSDPGHYLRRHSDKLVILDEIHRMPEIFREMRGVVDENRRKGKRAGQFLILGSASLDLLRQSGETLAGRIAYSEMHPLNVRETGEASLENLWIRGGFPDSFLAPSDKVSERWRRDFVRTYLERDVSDFGPRIPAERLRRLWTMIAHGQGGMLNAASLARSLGVDNKTVSTYLDLLVDLLLVRRLAPWHANVGKRLVKSPKVYVRDSGILHSLLRISDMEALLGNPIVGDSWEGFVIENILSATPDHMTPYFYRTSAGAEIDLVLDMDDGLWAIEVKRSTAPKLTKGFGNACEDLKPARKYVVYGGDDGFRMNGDVTVVSLYGMMEELKAI